MRSAIALLAMALLAGGCSSSALAPEPATASTRPPDAAPARDPGAPPDRQRELDASAGATPDAGAGVGAPGLDTRPARPACAGDEQGCQSDGWCWRVERVADAAGTLEPLALRAFSTGEVWAGGKAGAVFRFDGARWVRSVLPAGRAHDITTVAGSGPTDIWISGLLRFDGLAWRETGPEPAGGVTALWSLAANDAWVGGPDGLSHWDGNTWVSVVPQLPATALWGAGDGTLWGAAVTPMGLAMMDGSTTEALAAVRQVLMRFDGNRWLLQGVPPAPIRALAGTGPGDVWAVGDGGLLLRWNGAAWARVMAPAPANLRAVTAAAADQAWTAGEGSDLLVWEGRAWSIAEVGDCRPPSWTALSSAGPGDLWGLGGGLVIHYHRRSP